METYHSLDRLPPVSSSVLTVGMFDGLHKGHLEIIRRLRAYSQVEQVKAVVVTFDPHPQHVLRSNGDPKKDLVAPLAKKLALLADNGIDIAYVQHFDLEFSRKSAYSFLEGVLIKHFHPVKIVIGYDHHFGHNREGNAQFLKRYESRFSYNVEVLNAVNSSGRVVSSSLIRQLLRRGQVDVAAELLGWTYELPGTVIIGKRRGLELAYPTANLELREPDQLIPMMGVYFVSAEINTQTYFGMCNIGIRPTFDEKKLVIETHFFNLPQIDLYGTEMVLRFHQRLRDEKKFPSVEALTEQLARDKEKCLELIQHYYGGR